MAVIGDHLLVHRVTIQREVPTDAGSGRWQNVPTTIASDVPFRISGMSARELLVAQQLKSYGTHNGYGRPGLNIKRGDLLIDVVRDDGSSDPNTYRVMADVPTSLAHHTKVILEIVKKGQS